MINCIRLNGLRACNHPNRSRSVLKNSISVSEAIQFGAEREATLLLNGKSLSFLQKLPEIEWIYERNSKQLVGTFKNR